MKMEAKKEFKITIDEALNLTMLSINGFRKNLREHKKSELLNTAVILLQAIERAVQDGAGSENKIVIGEGLSGEAGN